jgi:serine/threonine-protein kinase
LSALPIAAPRYRPIARLAQGGMAYVFLARAEGPAGFAKLAVLKRLKLAETEDENQDLARMFLQEARLTAQLNHANIVQTFDVGQDGDGPYLAMEYLEGQTLATVLKRANREGFSLPRNVHLHVIAETLNAVHYAHTFVNQLGVAMPIVHRDVSPQNIFITYDGAIKLLDFGIARSASREGVEDTRHGVLKGKVAYMAPEQVSRPSEVDGRADIFSAGVLLWEALAKTRFWGDAKELEILAQLAKGHFVEAPSAHDADVPASLDSVTRQAVAFDRERRFATAQEFLEALEAAIASAGQTTSAREISRFMTTHFATDREKARAAVEAYSKRVLSEESQLPQLSADDEAGSRSNDAPLSDAPSGHSTPSPAPKSRSGVLPRRRSYATLPPRSLERAVPVADPGGSGPAVSLPPAAPSASPNRVPLFAIAAVAVVALAAAAFFATKNGAAPASTLAAPAQASVPTAEAVKANAPSPTTAATGEAPKTIALKVSVSPLSAKVFLDDRPLGANPFDGRMAVSDGKHTLRAEAPGFTSRSAELPLDRDREVEWVLAAVPNGASGRYLPAAANVAPAAAADGAKPASTIEELTPRAVTKPVLDTDALR